MAPSLERIDHIHVTVQDRAAAVAWYAKVLAFTPVAELSMWATDNGPLTIGNASGSIHLALFERAEVRNIGTIAYAVSAAEFLSWQTHLSAMLAREIKAVDHAVSWSLYFSDPDGNPFEITTYDYATLVPRLGAKSP
jgi:catechol-2,3-dioxygenase